jgi:predicted nuclease of restriction endonuclease-like RecB superfamily
MTDPVLKKKIAQIFIPGPLQQKHDEISLFLAGGYSMLYRGDVAWKLSIPEADQLLKGDAENMDEAFSQIKGVMEEIMKKMNPATKVAVSVKEKDA